MLRVTGLRVGNSAVNSPHKLPVSRIFFYLMTSSYIGLPWPKRCIGTWWQQSHCGTNADHLVRTLVLLPTLSLIAPMALAHPLHPIDNRSRNKRRNLWVGRCVSSWWPWFPSRSSVLIYMYICVHSLYEFCYRSYIQRECHSVLAKLHPITFYRGVRGSWSECHFVFSLVYQLCLALW